MFDYRLRSHRAVLDEFLPEWRVVLSEAFADFPQAWRDVTGLSRSNAFLWRDRALEVRSAEISLAVAA